MSTPSADPSPSRPRRCYYLPVAITGYFAWRLIDANNGFPFYFRGSAYGWQSLAFLHGRTALTHSLWQWLVGDSAFAHSGMQQIWGLGIPILRAPLDWIAHVAGIVYFPDGLFLLLFFMLAAVS